MRTHTEKEYLLKATDASIVYKGDKELASIGFIHDLRDERKLKEDLEKTQLQLLQAVKTYSSLENDNIVIKISDTGPGIPKDVLPRIFEPFFTTKNKGEGTGLGLSLAFSIAEEHGGDIRAKNNPDAGATFTVELPINQSDNGENQSGK